MSFRIEARVGVQASTDRIWEIVADLPGWSRWNPTFPEASGTIVLGGSMTLLERFEGLPERRAEVRISDWTPLSRLIWVEKRGMMFNSTRFIDIEELVPGSCIVTVGEIFDGWRAETYYEKHRLKLKAGYHAMAEALRQLAEA